MYALDLKQIKNVLPDAELGTTANQITSAGHDIIGPSFRGAFPLDKVPVLLPGQSTVINTDKSGLPGVHWFALLRGTMLRVYGYDPLGNVAPKFLTNYPHTTSKVVWSNPNSEQTRGDTDCGQRALAWINYANHMGIRNALKL